MAEVELVKVKSGLAPIPPRVPGNPPEHRLAFYQRHPDHPNGEVKVSGDKEVEVALTPEVDSALGDKRLVRAEAPKRGRKADKGDEAND